MKTNDDGNNPSRVLRRIFKIIDNMPEFEIRNLLIGLEKWKQNSGQRKHPRKDTHTLALFRDGGLSFREHVTNLSASGLFIETNIPLSVTNQLSIQFVHPESKNVVKTKGKIVRIDANGIGVKFDQPLTVS
jgi:hypothetical protein